MCLQHQQLQPTARHLARPTRSTASGGADAAAPALRCRQGCVVYSLGSFDDFTFEAAVLQRTACTVHVFDPTVLPSEMRRREEVLNGDGPVRVRWHSIGISDEDTDHSSCAVSSFPSPPIRGATWSANAAC